MLQADVSGFVSQLQNNLRVFGGQALTNFWQKSKIYSNLCFSTHIRSSVKIRAKYSFSTYLGLYFFF
jgi:hypothetical protein